MTVALVACGKAKRSIRSPAADLYTSSLFTLSLRYARAHCERVFVLSAMHGLVPLDQAIAPYNLQLSDLSPSARIQWDVMVAAAVRREIPATADLVVLAGENYCSFTASLPHHVMKPLAGLTLFERLRWLSQELRSQPSTVTMGGVA